MENVDQNLSKIENIEIEGINYEDYPDFCDAFLVSATLNGEPLTDEELDYINNVHQDWVYEEVLNKIF